MQTMRFAGGVFLSIPLCKTNIASQFALISDYKKGLAVIAEVVSSLESV